MNRLNRLPGDKPKLNIRCASKRDRLVSLGVVVLSLAVYLALARSGSGDIFSLYQKHDLYNLLTHAFQAGHTYLPVQPPVTLTSLPNPYDPVANASFRLHDASLYKGRYYVYFGITPVLTIFLPFRLLTGGDLSNGAACFLFAAGGYILSILLLLHFAARLRLWYPLWLRSCAFATLGLAQFVPFTLKRSLFYEVAILSGYFFSLAGLYALILGLEATTHRSRLLALAGLFFGLSIGARPTWVFGIVLLVALLLLCAVLRLRCTNLDLSQKDVCCLAGPISLCGMGLGFYNFTRFGSPFEFGLTYQLTEANGFTGFHPGVSKMFVGIFYFLLAPPAYSRSFPYALAVVRKVWSTSMPSGLVLEQVVGMLPAIPFSFIGLFAPLATIIPSVHRQLKTEVLSLTAVWLLPVGNLIVLCLSGWTTVRYSVDFVPGLLLASWILIPLLRPHGIWQSRVAGACVLVCSIYSVVLGLALGITGYYEGTLFSHPHLYQRIANQLSSLTGGSPLCLRPRVTVVETVGFPLAPDLTVLDPLLTEGHAGSATYVSVRYFSQNTASVSYQVWGQTEVLGERFSFEPAKTYSVTITITPERNTLQVLLNNRTVFDRQVLLNPTRLDEVTVGINPVWKFPRPRLFSGKIKSAAVTIAACLEY